MGHYDSRSGYYYHSNGRRSYVGDAHDDYECDPKQEAERKARLAEVSERNLARSPALRAALKARREGRPVYFTSNDGRRFPSWVTDDEDT